MTDLMRDFNAMKRAVCLLLDHAVHDVEKNDECINAVEFARNELRKHPNQETVAAMSEESL
jgi:hypothetical protein